MYDHIILQKDSFKDLKQKTPTRDMQMIEGSERAYEHVHRVQHPDRRRHYEECGTSRH